MKKRRILLALLCLLIGWGGAGMAQASTVNFNVTDVPGYWFNSGNTAPVFAGNRSLHIIAPGDTVTFTQFVESRHTVTSLIWPSTALASEKIDQIAANTDSHSITLNTPGLYVFVCKLHPYMLGAVIVDAPTSGLDIGEQITLAGVGSFNSNSNLGLRLLRAFFLVTNPSNWKDYTKVGQAYKPVYPAVPVRVTGGAVVPDLNAALQATFDGDIIPAQVKPSIKGVGEVWVDTQYELTDTKGPSYPGTISVVDVDAPIAADNWKVTRKIALPGQLMNNGHNMWASHNQEQIYQTEWHGKSLFVLDRVTGSFLKEIELGHDPAHVMTRVDTQQVHVTLNGEDGVVELNQVGAPNYLAINRPISMQDPAHPSNQTQPHAHWMGFDGKTMATPNSNTSDSTLYDFEQDRVISKLPTGALSIAVGMMPDSSKYYVSNYLGHTLTVINMKNQKVLKNISLLGNYDPISGLCAGEPCKNIGALPIQTPVSPDGKFVITANTLTGTITIVDTRTDEVVNTIKCDPGCHGVNFGAKQGGGYYAYVTSKFSNRLIVLDYDVKNNGSVKDAMIVGWVVLADNYAPSDDTVTAIAGNNGMGGQGVLPVPNVYNGWVQKLPNSWKLQLTKGQRNPFP